MKKYLILSLAILFILSLTLSAIAVSDPEGEGVQKIRSLVERGETIWLGAYIQSSPEPELDPGTPVEFYVGVAAHTDSCEVFEDHYFEIAFTINGTLVSSGGEDFGEPYMAEDGYCALYWVYVHPPFSPGVYSWEAYMEGGPVKEGSNLDEIIPVTINGEFEVVPPKGK